MKCMNCGVQVTPGLDYCNRCGWNVSVQKKAVYLSKIYYNRGLEKASIRDLSGAIGCLKQSLKFYKGNIQARNLLGLVYFETGEVVSALSEWVISKNLMPNNNLAETYISKLQANPNKLENINQTIRKYNQALEYCRQGHEDMAAIQLRKVLAQNPKLIKGYHLLALLQIKEGAYAKARKTLRKAAKIDKTNTTTLRFLREIDLQTGVVTNLNKKEKRGKSESEVVGYMYHSGNDTVIHPPAFRESSMWGTLLTLGIGIAVGVAALWFLVIPDRTQKVLGSANDQILLYGDQLATRDAEISRLEAELETSQVSSNDTQKQTQEASKKVTDYDKLVQAVSYFNQANYAMAGSLLSEVGKDSLSAEAAALYDAMKQNLVQYMQQDGNGDPTQTGEGQDGMADMPMDDLSGY
ncbi:MAG: hypothetical protein HFH60_08295 [Lachnospiraceae bacterium]|nr:hypothetical protein [Lachnospiraceae bacterium]